MDPYYRTIEGFQVLVEKEWLHFGHKFGDRCGHGVGSDDTNERCPVFLQWIDCIYQIHCQFPCSFEFSTSYLIKLAQHVYSCLFGTFLCNTLKERLENSIPDRTFSIWPFLSASIYKNPLYESDRDKILWPSHSVRSLVFWSEFYFGSFHKYSNNNNNNASNIPENFSNDDQPNGGLIKTRSFSDLAVNQVHEKHQLRNGSVRRLSDPSISYDEKNNSSMISFIHTNGKFEDKTKDEIDSSSTTQDEDQINNCDSNGCAENGKEEQDIKKEEIVTKINPPPSKEIITKINKKER